jgi:hypothetical protein
VYSRAVGVIPKRGAPIHLKTIHIFLGFVRAFDMKSIDIKLIFQAWACSQNAAVLQQVKLKGPESLSRPLRGWMSQQPRIWLIGRLGDLQLVSGGI